MQAFILSSLLAAGALAAPAPVAGNAAGKKIALPKRSVVARNSGELDTAWFLGNLNYTIQKYGKQSLKSYDVSSPDIVKRQSEEALVDQIEDGEDELYYGSGSVGGQSGFTFDFDTGSSDTFVPGPTCGSAKGCAAGPQYGNTGQDEGNTTTVTYGSGQVSGENYFDSVTIAGLTATHQNIISLTQAAGFANSDSNSLMGMAFQSIAASGQPPYFKTLIDEGKVSTQEFSFYLGRAADGTGANSEMTLGGRDTTKFTGTPTQIAVSTPGYWQIPLEGVTVGGSSGLLGPLLSPGQAAIDTGTTIILAPLLAAQTIFNKIPGSIPIPLELVDGELEPVLYAYPCASNPDVAITFGGKNFAIDPRDLNFGQLTPDFGTIIGNNTLATFLNDNASYCLAAIAGDDIQPSENLYVVGDTFLKNWYSIFSYDAANGNPAVSFAKSI